MANTYKAIATVTVGSGGAATIDFTSIPATYTDLLIKLCARGTSTAGSAGNVGYLKPNGSTSNQTRRILYGLGNSSGSDPGTDWAYYIVPSDHTANTFGNTEIYLPNYASSNNKSASFDSVTENNATTAYMMLSASLWADVSVISSLTMSLAAGNFAQYSTATLYGIKNS
jgi:hypothetical protein